VVGVISPLVVGHPRPPVFGVDPFAVRVRLPAAGDPRGHPAVAVAPVIAVDPPAVRFQLVVEPADRDAH
jgi:hypothetical protein